MADGNYITHMADYERGDRIFLYKDGMNFPRTKVHSGQPSHLLGVRRSKIKTFTLAAARRLREQFFFYDVPDSSKVGICFTVPMDDDIFRSPDVSWFKRLWHDFAVNLRNHYPNVGMVYRLELQKRKTPHVHAVVYFIGDNPCSLIGREWVRACCREAERLGTFPNPGKHTVKVDKLDHSSIGYFRYLTDHASKHKRDQLGYAGKQWGVFNSHLFKHIHGEGQLVFESEEHINLFIRYFQRFNRRPVTVQFGSGKDKTLKIVKYRRSRRSRGVSFCRGGSDTIRRLFECAKANSRPTPYQQS